MDEYGPGVMKKYTSKIVVCHRATWLVPCGDYNKEETTDDDGDRFCLGVEGDKLGSAVSRNIVPDCNGKEHDNATREMGLRI